MRKLVKIYDPFRELEEYKLELFGIDNIKNSKWIAVNSSRGGILKEPWLIVPNEINRFGNVSRILNNIQSITVKERLDRFGLNETDITAWKPKLFAYFLGVLIGDASKHANKRKFGTTRRIGLSLTKRYISNENFGEFVCMCANSLGLRMERIKDTQPGRRNLYPFYRWSSQSSMLIQWIFNICLGLNDNQLTTYDSINAKWILKSPKYFQTWFIQGVADSDGFIDVGAQQVGIITQPNTKFIKSILENLGVTSRERIFDNRLEGLMISLKDAYRLPVFNSFVKSYRFELLEKLIKADRIYGHWPKWLSNKIDDYLKSGLNGTSLVRGILDENNTIIRTKQLYRRGKILDEK